MSRVPPVSPEMLEWLRQNETSYNTSVQRVPTTTWDAMQMLAGNIVRKHLSFLLFVLAIVLLAYFALRPLSQLYRIVGAIILGVVITGAMMAQMASSLIH